MGIYNTFGYSDGTLYGISSKIEFSVDPFTSVAIDYVKDGGDIIRPQVELSWVNPAGAISGFRIVRNQDGFSESEEDGHVIFEVFEALPDVQQFTDKDFIIPLTPGLYAYYTIWLLRPDQTWFPAGITYCLIPKEHSLIAPDGVVLATAQDKFVGLLPRVYTTLQQSYVDEIDPSSDIYSFLGGFSFTLDEILTYIDLVTPTIQGANTNPNFVPVQAAQLGLKPEPTLGLRTQKRLIRQAVNMYRTRGTLIGLQTFIETLTSFAPVITVSANEMVDAQNSSFYNGVGNWVADSNCTLISATDLAPFQGEEFAVDRTYAGKVVSSSSNAVISNGISNPKLNGTPVSPGVNYLLSYYQTAPSSTGTITPIVTWYDYAGNVLKTAITGSAVAATSSWAQQTMSLTSPGISVAATTATVVSNVATVTVDAGHPFNTGDTVIISGIGYPFDNAHVVTSTTSTSISFSVADDDIASTPVSGVAHEPYAYFAAIQFNFSTAGTYYVDMIQLADSTDVRSSAFYEARGLEIFLTPSKTNYIENPSFSPTVDVEDVDWAYTNAVSTTYISPTTVPGIFDGSHMVQVVTDNSSPFMVQAQTYTVESNAYYTFSIYSQCLSGEFLSSLWILALDSSGSLLVGKDGLNVANSTNVLITESWSRHSVTVFVPNTTSPVHFKIGLSGITVGGTINLDAAQLERGYTSTDYFDGSYSSRGAFWLENADDSMSVLYRNKSNKIGRLVAELPDNLPMNTPWVITTGSQTVKVLETSGFSS